MMHLWTNPTRNSFTDFTSNRRSENRLMMSISQQPNHAAPPPPPPPPPVPDQHHVVGPPPPPQPILDQNHEVGPPPPPPPVPDQIVWLDLLLLRSLFSIKIAQSDLLRRRLFLIKSRVVVPSPPPSPAPDLTRETVPKPVWKSQLSESGCPTSFSTTEACSWSKLCSLTSESKYSRAYRWDCRRRLVAEMILSTMESIVAKMRLKTKGSLVAKMILSTMESLVVKMRTIGR